MTSTDCVGWPTSSFTSSAVRSARRKHNARLPVRAEARLLDGQHVLACGQSEDVIFAALVGDDGIAGHRRLVLGLHFGLWHGQPGRILNRAEELGAARLSEANSGGGEHGKRECGQRSRTDKHVCYVRLTM